MRLFGDDHPAYGVPSMASTRAIPYTGLRAISTFSGCGGSSLGLRRAGFRVLAASEFIPAARDTYAANFPETLMLSQDIRDLDPVGLLEELEIEPGELDLFEGSPPCASFSTSNRHKGKEGMRLVRPYSDGISQRTDDLFDEWLRLLAAFQPRAAVAENVPGLWMGEAEKYLGTILTRILRLGYRVEARILNAATYGAATARHRVIIVAVREDLPAFAWPGGGWTLYTVRDALSTAPPNPEDELAWALKFQEYPVYQHWLQRLPGEQAKDANLRLTGVADPFGFNLIKPHWDQPLPAATQSGKSPGAYSVTHPEEPRKLTATELAWISGFPADFILTGSPQQRYERIGRAVPPPMYEAVGGAIARVLLSDPARGPRREAQAVPLLEAVPVATSSVQEAFWGED